jgi:hypothetical protein
MNKPVVLLRVASALTLIHAVLHTIGGVFGKVEAGPAAVAVAAMKANQFLLMGNMRSYWDFYFGMGLALSISMTAEGILMWQLASLARTEARRLRPMMATLLVAYLVIAMNSYAHFFPAPVIFEIIIAGCFGAAIATANKPASGGN